MHFYYDSDLNIYHDVVDAVRSGKQCWFYFNDDVLSKVDWKIEPTESLSELYRIRAQQIRDEYPYLILCYSGGTDSTAVLETFYYNNIHIDEILMVGALSQDPHEGSDKNQNGCLYHNAFPLLSKLSLPNTKITTLDYTQYFENDKVKDFSLIKQYGDEWMKHTGVYHSVTHLFWYDLKRIVGAYNNKKTAVIFGSEKTFPLIDHNDRSYVSFSNQSFCDYGNIYNNENFHRVNFFSSGDQTSINIMVKQAHVVTNVRRFCAKQKLKEPHINDIIYEYRDKPTFTSLKCVYPVLSPRDTFLLGKKDSEIYKAFEYGKEFLNKYIPISKQTVLTSRRYYIE